MRSSNMAEMNQNRNMDRYQALDWITKDIPQILLPNLHHFFVLSDKMQRGGQENLVFRKYGGGGECGKMVGRMWMGEYKKVTGDFFR